MPALKGQRGQAPDTIEDMQLLARKHNGCCLSSEYRDTRTKLQWQCDKGHTWESTPDNVKAGSWCRVCSKARRKAHWLGEMQALALARGGRCLSDTYTTNAIKLRWQCGEGHIWEARPSGLRQYGSWYPECGFEKLRLKIDDMHAAARERGGECLSARYVNNETKLRWRCSDGHEWETKPMRIRLGNWCPVCARKWRMLTMAQIDAMAQARGGICVTRRYDNDGRKLRWRCGQGHEWMAIPSRIKRGAWCPQCAHPSYTIADMHSLAKRRGGACLSPRYIDSQTKLQWQCDRGHVWSTCPAVVIKGHWCPECAHLSRSRRRESRRKYLDAVTGN